MKQYFVQSALAKTAKMLADKFGLIVTFSGGAPRTDGKKILLPAISDELPEEEQQDLLAYIVHEVAHILFTEMALAETFVKAHGRKAFELLNALEDVRIEYLMEKEYIGAKRVLDESNVRLTKRFESGVVPDSFRQFASMLYLKGRGYQIPKSWDKSVEQKADELQAEIKAAVQANNTTEVGEIALEILKRLQEEEATAPEEAPKDGAEKDSASNDGEPDKGDVNAQKGGDDTDATCSVLSMDDSSAAVNPHEMLVEHLQKKCEQQLKQGRGLVYRRYDPSIDHYDRIPHAATMRVRAHEDEIRPYVNAVRAKLLTALTAQGQTRWLSHQEDGVIDSNRLPALITRSSGRVFKRRVTGRSKSTAVTLLIDTSGSMSGKRIAVARSLAMVFADVLCRANITSRVIGFDGSGDFPGGQPPQDYPQLCQHYTHVGPVHYSLLKDFHEQYSTVKARFPKLRTGGITPLAPALLQEVSVLLEQQCDRRILFVLSDGDPNSDCNISDIECREICADMVSQATRAGVEVFGVGIGLDVSSVFNRNVMINDITELPKTVLRELHNLLLRR